VLNVFAWYLWCRDIFRPSRLLAPYRVRAAMVGNVVLCLALILIVLVTASSADVQCSGYYVCTYELLAALGLAGGLWLLPFFGISPRDDVVERRNKAAFWAVNGAFIGLAACFAGANIGNGPGPQAVLFCAVLGSISFFVVWFVADLAGGHWTDAIAIERDHGSGMRLGSLLSATGLAFGSALTGDWVSAEDTLRDFAVRSWPVIPVLCVALLAERPLRRSPRIRDGWFAAVVYVALGILCVHLERRSR